MNARMRHWLLAFLLLLPTGAHAQRENLMPALGALDRGDYKQAIDTLRPLAADGTIEAQYVLAGILETAPPPWRDLKAALELVPARGRGRPRGRAEQPRRDVLRRARRAEEPASRRPSGTGSPPTRALPWRRPTSPCCTAWASACRRTRPRWRSCCRPRRKRASRARRRSSAACTSTAKACAQNAAEAVKWFRNAAAQDNEGAQFLLAVLLQRGIGAPRDFEAAVAWFRRAANQGNRLAMLELAKAYELGLGIPADPAQAKTWRELAQKKPDPEAQKKDDAASNQRADPRRSRP